MRHPRTPSANDTEFDDHGNGDENPGEPDNNEPPDEDGPGGPSESPSGIYLPYIPGSYHKKCYNNMGLTRRWQQHTYGYAPGFPKRNRLFFWRPMALIAAPGFTAPVI